MNQEAADSGGMEMGGPGPRQDPTPTSDRTTQMLGLGITGPRRPVDDLADRFEKPDGAAWMEGAIRRLGTTFDFSMTLQHLTADPAPDLEGLRRVKDACARGGPADPSRRLEFLLGYFLAITAGLARHGVVLTSRPGAEVRAALETLTASAPAEWTGLFARATRLAEDAPGGSKDL